MSGSRNDDDLPDEDWDKEIEDEAKASPPATPSQDDQEEEDWDAEIDADEAVDLKANLKARLDLGDDEDSEEVSKTVEIYQGVAKTFNNPTMATAGALTQMGPDTLLVAAYFTGKQEIIDDAVQILTKLSKDVQGLELSPTAYQKTFERACKPFTDSNTTYDKSKYDLTAETFISLAQKTGKAENVDLARNLLTKAGYEMPAEAAVKGKVHDPSAGTQHPLERLKSAAKSYQAAIEQEPDLEAGKSVVRKTSLKGGA